MEGDSEYPLPTAETTVFNDKDVVVATGLVERFLTAEENKEPKAFKEIARFAKDTTRREVLSNVVFEQAEDANSKEEGRDEERVEKYNRLQESLNGIYILGKPPEGMSPEDKRYRLDRARSTRLRTLERAGNAKHLEEISRITNTVMQDALPEEYGTVIPELLPSDINIVTDASFREMQRTPNGDEDVVRAINKIYESHGIETKAPTDNQKSRILTEIHVSGEPIVMQKQMQDEYQKVGKGFSPEFAGFLGSRTFIHESFHRAHQTRIPQDLSFDDGFELSSASGRVLAARNSKLLGNEQLEADINRVSETTIKQIAHDKDAFVFIAGTFVSLGSFDNEGNYKIIQTSGYDLNEAMVEYLVHPALDSMLDYYDKNLKGDWTRSEVKASIFSTDESSYILNDYTKKVPEYLKSLGLTTHQEQLEAFVSGQIPLLHLKTFGAETPYLT